MAEGCDRRCGFCAIPSFRGAQRSRPSEAILAEVDELGGPADGLREVVLVAQDLSSFALDRSGRRDRPIRIATAPVRRRPTTHRGVGGGGVRRGWHGPASSTSIRPRSTTGWSRPSSATGVPYFDLSLQHVSRPLLKQMRRWGDGDRFLDGSRSIRTAEPDAAFRSSFIVGYPGETEADHDRLLEWLVEAHLDWVGFFPFSHEAGTHAAGLDGQVPAELVAERLGECSELQDAITPAAGEELDRHDGRRSWWTRPGSGGPTAKRPKSTASWLSRPIWPPGLRRGGRDRGRGTGPGGRAGRSRSAGGLGRARTRS